MQGLQSRWGRLASVFGAWVLGFGVVACASGPPTAPPPPEWSAQRVEAVEQLEGVLAEEAPALTAGMLLLRLAFGAEADLDLYVTDPQLETLYYANTPVRSGGELLEDQRCDATPAFSPGPWSTHPPRVGNFFRYFLLDL